MEQQSLHKSYQYRLTPTPAQEQALEVVVLRCRTLYNCALEQRKTRWERGQGKSVTYYQQKAELPDLKAACPQYAEVNAQVLQDVSVRAVRRPARWSTNVASDATPDTYSSGGSLVICPPLLVIPSHAR